MKYSLLCIALLAILFSCSDKQTEKSNKRAFYYWQTSMDSFNWNDSTYEALQVDRIYLRLFDVDWDEELQLTIPVSPLRFDYYSWGGKTDLVPVVFITNNTFKKLTKEQSVELAHQVHRKMTNMTAELIRAGSLPYNDQYDSEDPYRVLSKNFDEQQKKDSAYHANMATIKQVQFDCDWTDKTRDNYFAFLEECNKLFKDKEVTSTIRLYQYKYPDQAGVPPVKRGMLMCYNAGNIKDPETKNSIFDISEIKSYLSDNDYKLPLDYALPTFEWGVLFQNGKFSNILSAEELRAKHNDHLNFESKTLARATEDFVYGDDYNGILIRQGDEIRIETSNMQDVQEIAKWISENKNNKEALLCLYHLNNYDLEQHSETIKSIFSSF